MASQRAQLAASRHQLRKNVRRDDVGARGTTTVDALEKAKAIATICSAVAIPLVLTVAGYFIQKQLSEEGLRKDYVGIATAILKENVKGQEPELRAWAVKVLDENSPIPFSKKAKEGLLTGAAVSGIIWIGPPADCLKRSKKRTFIQEYDRLAEESKAPQNPEFSARLVEFINRTAKQEYEVEMTAVRLSCMQDWAAAMEKSDIEYRLAIGAPSSKSVLEEMRSEQAASQAKLGKPPKQSQN